MVKKLSLLLLGTLLFATTNVTVQGKEDHTKQFQEVRPGVFERELTDRETIQKYGKQSDTIDKDEILGNVLSGSTLLTTEEYTDEDGNRHLVKYYRPKFKDSEIGQKIKASITQNQSEELRDQSVSPLAARPEEGDVRIDVEFERMEKGEEFDSTSRNYWSTFTTEYYSKALDFGSGLIFSNPIAELFTGAVLDDLREGNKGKGDAISYYRVVTKMGQVYHDGAWEDYYETFQREWYWSHEQISYDSNNRILNTVTQHYFPDSDGYLPIEWAFTEDFNDDYDIQEIAMYQYSLDPDRARPARDFLRYEYHRSDWNEEGELDY
ncbi:Peptidase [Brevibacillus sp. IT-7CA2]|uniref:hypothetical protein n=1 Tax=Brevibacillus sp. IT-7CA2 TaxID=3026436 RepID=UPI0039E15EAF